MVGKLKKGEIHTLQNRDYGEKNEKNVENEKKTLVRKENNEKNEIQTLFDMEYSKKH